MTVYQNPELVALFETYTGGPSGIAADLTRVAAAADAGAPLLVATATDLVLYPGNGEAPSVQGFRMGTRGFKELAAVSHLGPAMASLVNMRRLDPASDLWRRDAKRLLAATRTARSASTPSLWRDRIAVEAWRGREDSIAAMLDYGCALTLRYLEAVVADEAKLTPEFLRRSVLEAEGRELEATVPFNWVMIATFFLAGLDVSHRIIGWLAARELDWTRTMVLICGKQGRPTSGVTWTTNSVAQMILAASDHALPLDRLYIAPHGPTFVVSDPDNLEPIRAVEGELRALWSYTRAISDLSPTMFDGYPRYAPGAYTPPVVTAETSALSEMPAIAGPQDMRAMVTRLRMVQEDPRQLLSGCVADYAAEQLRRNGNDPRLAVVPGLDGVVYPTGM